MQPRVEALKKIEFQLLKTIDPSIFLDEQIVYMVQSLLNANLDADDIITDAEMPTTFLGATLDWSVGSTVNDTNVSITYGDVSITQDLADANVVIPGLSESEEYEAAMIIAQAINNEDVPDSGYTWVDTATTLSDALTLATTING